MKIVFDKPALKLVTFNQISQGELFTYAESGVAEVEKHLYVKGSDQTAISLVTGEVGDEEDFVTYPAWVIVDATIMVTLREAK